MAQTKIYTIIKAEAREGADAINILITTTDKEKALRKFKREVSLDKKTNPYWQNGNRQLFEDTDGYYYVYDINEHMMNYTLIVLKETILK
jgi:hypothetical protein